MPDCTKCLDIFGTRHADGNMRASLSAPLPACKNAAFFASTKCSFFASTKVQHANAREHGREGTQLKQLALVNRAEQTKLMDQNGDVVIVKSD